MNNFEFKKQLLECLVEDKNFAKEIFSIILKEKEVSNMILEVIGSIDLKIKKVNERAKLPIYGSDGAAAFDLHCLLDTESITLSPGETVELHTGLSMSIPAGYVGIVAARSGLGCKKGLIPSNAIGVIDSDYRGEIKVVLYNHSKESHKIEDNERVAQMMIMPVAFAKLFLVEELDETERGSQGFGHSGRK